LTSPWQELNRALDYRFGHPSLLQQALTHRSAGAPNNERLEFLGDGVLNFIVAAELFHAKPHAAEGELSRLRASLVRRETLARIARDIHLGDYLCLGTGELKSGGFTRETILADALEAVIGAVFLDGDFDACRDMVARLWRPYLGALPEATELKDPKTRLQEYLQGKKISLPEYRVVDISGKAHEQQFTVECQVKGLQLSVRSPGASRRRAEQAAARRILERLAVPMTADEDHG
jgi:ribonuclease-3